MLCPTVSGARQLRARLEDELTEPYAELSVHDAPGYCERLLRAEPIAAGLDPFFVVAGRADRVAMLSARVDELALVRHDFMGRPTALMVSIVARIDRLEDELVDAATYAAWAQRRAREASGDAAADEAQLECEFAEVYLAHDRMLAQQGTLDRGGLVARACALLAAQPQVRRRAAQRHPYVLVDDLQDLTAAGLQLVITLAGEQVALLATADEGQAIARRHGVLARNVARLRAALPAAEVIALAQSHRCPPRVLAAARAVRDGATAPEDRAGLLPDGAGPPGEVRFWRAANERGQAQAVAADVERLIARQGVAAERIAILVRSVRREGRGIAAALSERAIPHRLLGAGSLFDRAEVRDVLAWMRLLIDPRDAAAASRTLVRAPIELRSIDLARVVAISRRRRLDMVSAAAAAIESPQVAPQARERLQSFLRLHRSAEQALDSTRPDMFVTRLIDRLGLRRQQLFAAHSEAVAQLLGLARLGEVVAAFQSRAPQATPRELAAYLNAVADVGLEDDDRGVTPRGEVVVMNMAEARGREFDHVYVLGLHAARIPGTGLPPSPVPAELLPAELLRAELPGGPVAGGPVAGGPVAGGPVAGGRWRESRWQESRWPDGWWRRSRWRRSRWRRVSRL